MVTLTTVAPTSNIPTRIGELRQGALVIHRARPARAPADAPERRPMKTATDRAVEAIEAAEKIFADEMGATLSLSATVKTALVATITAAIQAAVAEEMRKLTPAR